MRTGGDWKGFLSERMRLVLVARQGRRSGMWGRAALPEFGHADSISSVSFAG